MIQYHVKATVNYPETEVDTPDHVAYGFRGLTKWLDKLMDEKDATSFLITIVPKATGA